MMYSVYVYIYICIIPISYVCECYRRSYYLGKNVLRNIGFKENLEEVKQISCLDCLFSNLLCVRETV